MAKFLELEKQSKRMAEPLETNPSNSKEVDDDMTEPTASLDHTHQVPYEVRTEGPLTYFHYYFEEVDSTINSETIAVHQSAAKFLPNRYLVGAGVLTATALSGLALADMNKPQVAAKPSVPTPDVQQNSPKATASTQRLKLIGTEVQPLQANQPLWSQSNPNVSKTPNAKLMASAALQQRSPMGETAPPLTAGPSKGVSTLPPPRFSLLPVPKVAGGMNAVSKTQPVPTVQPTAVASQTAPTAKPQLLPNSQPTPQPLPSPQPLSSTPLSSTPLPAVNPSIAGSQATGISQPETLAPQASGASAPFQAPAPMPAQTTPPSFSAQPITRESQPLETAVPEQAQKDWSGSSTSALSEKDALKAVTGALNAQSVLPQSIQDLLNRSRPSPTGKAVTLVPLTQKAAEEISGMSNVEMSTDKARRFTVLHLSLQDYRQAWLARNKTAQPQVLMNAFPTYGFVDYQTQVIAVLNQKQLVQTNPQIGMLPAGT
ncbi:MAG: hypothetical protein ACAF41_04090 [Leptolyngbya sp. BL-A-14]